MQWLKSELGLQQSAPSKLHSGVFGPSSQIRSPIIPASKKQTVNKISCLFTISKLTTLEMIQAFGDF